MRLKPNDRTHRLNAIAGTQGHEEKTIMKTKAFLFTGILFTVGLIVGVAARPATTKDADWPRWRGPFETGMALGDAPTTWSDSKNVKWKVPIPGRGHSSPVLWGDQIFVTTAVPIGAEPEGEKPVRPQPGADAPRRGGGASGG